MNSFHPNILSIQVDDEFFDMIDDVNHIYFTDYTYLNPPDNQPIRISSSAVNQPLLIGREPTFTELCGDKWHRPITTIDEMKVALRDIIDTIREISWPMNMTGFPMPSDPPSVLTTDQQESQPAIVSPLMTGTLDIRIDDTDVELLVEQVVFDLLFDKYIMESELMARNRYATIMSDLLSPIFKKPLMPPNVDAQLSRFMDKYINKMSEPPYRNQLAMLGIDPDAHNDYFNPDLRNNPNAQKPKFIWDLFFYNSGPNKIFSRIYRRQLTKESRNYSYKDFIRELDEYADMVDVLLPTEDAEPKDYFVQSMDYYILESYKRLDFILKLMPTMSKMGITQISKDHFLVKRYHPLVLLPYLSNGRIKFSTKHKYYRPMFMIEDDMAAEIQRDSEIDESKYGTRLANCQFVRAKAYEIFKYHYKYGSSDHADIKEFLQQSYNLASYHSSTRQWTDFKKADWDKLGRISKSNFKKQMKGIINITGALFWKYGEDE